MFFVTVTQLMRDTLLSPIDVCEIAHEEAVACFVDRTLLPVFFRILLASKDNLGKF